MYIFENFYEQNSIYKNLNVMEKKKNNNNNIKNKMKLSTKYELREIIVIEIILK